MNQIIIAVLLWGVVISVTFGRAPDGDRSVLISAIAFAVSLSFNIGPLYLVIDQVLGGRNWLELVSDLAMMAGISFLLRGLLRATNGAARTHERVQSAALVIVCVLMTALFLSIQAPVTSTGFMLSYGAQPGAAVYSILQFVSVAAAVTIMGYASLRHLTEITHPVVRAAFLLIAAGCGCAVALSACIIIMDIAHVAGDLRLMRAASAWYGPLYVTTIALLCVGFSAPPLLRRVNQRRRQRDRQRLLHEVSKVWRATVDVSDAIPVEPYLKQHFCDREERKDAVLHRMVVEIRDTTSHTRTPLPAAADQIVRQAEALLLPENSGAGRREGK